MTNENENAISTGSRPSWDSIFLFFLAAVFAGCCLVLGASFFLGKSHKLITSDGNAYYAWLPTVFIDHDLDFSNNFRALYRPDPGPDLRIRTPMGLVVNKCPVGMAIMEIPGFFAGHLAARLGSFPANGASAPYQIAVAFWLLLLYMLGLYLFFLALRAYGIGGAVAFFFCAMALIGTNWIHYVAKEPTMPHAANVALISFLLFAAARGRTGARRDFLAGLLLGLLLITRNAAIAVVPWIVFLLFRKDPAPRRFPAFLAGVALMGLIHFESFYLLWGQPVLRTYGDEGFTGGMPGMIGSLFSARHGLFIYHPWYLVLLVLNLAALWRVRAERTATALALGGFVLLWIFNGNWWSWWFGAGFGNRAFIETLVPLTLGAAVWVDHELDRWAPAVKRTLLILALAVVAVNLQLWAGYLLRRYSPSGRHTTIRETYLWAWPHNKHR